MPLFRTRGTGFIGALMLGFLALTMLGATTSTVHAEEGNNAHSGAVYLQGAVATGPTHACGLLSPGEVTCWGSGEAGKLGNGSDSGVGDGIGRTISKTEPVELGAKAREVAVGDLHSCALLQDGDVACWGRGDDGRLGYEGQGNVGDKRSNGPAQAPRVDLKVDAIALAAGGDSTCVVTEKGSVTCWGRMRAPYQVALSGDAATVAVSAEQACAVLTDGAVECWTPGGAPSVVPLDDAAKAVALGSDFGCALLIGGDPECWSSESDPMPLETDEPAMALAVGGTQACVIGESGSVACWDEETQPREVGVFAAAIAVGADYSCALTTSSELACWGDGAWGKLGYGDVDSRSPNGEVAQVATGSTMKTVEMTFGGKESDNAPEPSDSGFWATWWWALLAVPVLGGVGLFARRWLQREPDSAS